MRKRSKRYKELLKSVVKEKKFELKEIVDLVKKNSTTKFDESIALFQQEMQRNYQAEYEGGI